MREDKPSFDSVLTKFARFHEDKGFQKALDALNREKNIDPSDIIYNSMMTAAHIFLTDNKDDLLKGGGL
jgi:hypothetical protein